MASDYLFAVGTIGLSKCRDRKPSTLLQAARHNRREIQAEFGANGHIDASRMHLNETLVGPDSAAGVLALAKALMAEAGVVPGKLRKDHTQAIELLFSLPTGSAIDEEQYFRRCLSWAQERFGSINVLSADIHRDEATPHCHVLIMPLVEGRMAGSLLKGRKETAAMRDSFYRDVARCFGLKKPTGPLVGAARINAVKAVMQALERMHDPLLDSTVLDVVRMAIERDPAPYMTKLGISTEAVTPLKKQRTMAQIFTSPGKGPKTIAIGQKASKTIAMQEELEKRRSLSCVVIADQAPVLSATESPPGLLHRHAQEMSNIRIATVKLTSDCEVLHGGDARQEASNDEWFFGPSQDEGALKSIFRSSQSFAGGQCRQMLPGSETPNSPLPY